MLHIRSSIQNTKLDFLNLPASAQNGAFLYFQKEHIHQNMKLMLSVIDLEKLYHDLTEMMLCYRQPKICMIHRCKNCPGIGPVEKFLCHYMEPYMYRIQRIMRTMMILMKLKLILNNGQQQMEPI